MPAKGRVVGVSMDANQGIFECDSRFVSSQAEAFIKHWI